MKSFARCFALLCTGIFLCCGMTFAMEENGNSDVARLEKFRTHIASLQSLTFHFNQLTSGQMSGGDRTASGEAFLVKERDTAKIRWNYQTPDTQVILSDGRTLKMYFEKLHQMMVSPAEALQQDMTYAFLTGQKKVTDAFIIERVISENNLSGEETTEISSAAQNDIFRLTPKTPDNSLQFITVWISEDNELKRLEMVDNFDTITSMTFSSIAENTLSATQAAELFSFTPPDGTEIIEK